MPIVPAGTLNDTALIVPDLYVQIASPQSLALNGVPSNIVGVVGTASWGPVNQATVIGTMAGYASTFGAVQARKYDMGTAVALSVQQGASNFRCVRVTDTTDAAATVVVLSTCITFTALYTGTLGNSCTVSIAPGSKANTFQVVVGIPGLQPEIFNNIPGSANALWINMAAAINNGNGALRGASNLVTATAGVGTTAPSTATYTLTGGTDGVASLTAAVLVGSDTSPRKGMYALRSNGCSIGVLADADDSTQWTTIDGFGQSEGLYMVQVVPASTSVATAVTAKATAGLDSYSTKLMHGDWLYWNDQTNGSVRLVSPQGFAAGRLANLSPEQSSLNKPLFGVVGSQKSGAPGSSVMQTYASADLSALFSAGIDVISNPQPGGTYWGVRDGHNSSSNQAVDGDNYTRMTNYIAATLSAGMGKYVGQLINTALFQNVTATLTSFLANMLQQGQLGSTDGSLPYTVVCNNSNNPFSRTALGYLQADVAVRYQAINEKFIVNLMGGQTTVILSSTTPTTV